MKPEVQLRQEIGSVAVRVAPAGRGRPSAASSGIANSPLRPSSRQAATAWDIALFSTSTAALIGYLVWVAIDAVTQHRGPSQIPIATEELLVLLSAIAAALGASLAFRRKFDRSTKRAWMLFALAQVATGIVSASWIYRLAYGSSGAGSATIQLIAAAFYVFMLWSLVTFPVRRLDSHDRATFWLDSAIVAGVAAVLTWHLLLRAALVAAGSDWRTSIYALAYPVGDVVLLFAAIALLLRRPLPSSVRAIRILAVGILLNTAADVMFMWAYIAKESGDTPFTNITFILIAWMGTAAAFSQSRNRRLRLHGPAETADEPRRGRPSFIPYVAIIAIYSTLLIEVYRTEARNIVATIGSGHGPSIASRYPITTLVAGAIVVTAIVIARQISAQRKNTELAAERLAREAHFRALVQHSSDMVLVLRPDGIVREASPAVARVLGHAPELVIGKPFWEFFAADDMSVVQADLAQALAAGEGDDSASGPCEWCIRDAHGVERWIEAICTNLIDDPVVAGLVINGRDVSERKQLEAELTHRAYHDPLTGLVNRSRFRTKVAEAIDRTSSRTHPEDGRSGLAILYIDLDGFKAVNDIFGHDAGDVVLAAVADRLRDATRGSDTAARLGGDEFAILLERLRDAEEVTMVAKRVLHLVRAPVRIDHREVAVGASIGIVCASLGDAEGETAATLDPDALLRNADLAMYAAKARGRGNYEFFAPGPGGIV
jgi:diguanylate cyclase (GGDEF)-like protein/PAS domain S-box-containing protein